MPGVSLCLVRVLAGLSGGIPGIPGGTLCLMQALRSKLPSHAPIFSLSATQAQHEGVEFIVVHNRKGEFR